VLPPVLEVDPPSLSFTLPRGVAMRSQLIRVSNRGGGTLSFTVAASVSTPISWLRATPASGEAKPDHPANVNVTVNTANIGPGTYTGSITISTAGQSRVIPVVLSIS